MDIVPAFRPWLPLQKKKIKKSKKIRLKEKLSKNINLTNHKNKNDR